MKNLLILGATSEIARQIAFQAPKNNYMPILCGRNRHKLNILANDLKTRLSSEEEIPFYECDLLNPDSSIQLLKKIQQDKLKIDGVFIASGIMYTQNECEQSPQKALEMIYVNYSALVSFILNLEKFNFSLEFISVISSVAGDRGRLCNFLYGSTKSALSTFMEGLRVKYSNTPTLIQTIKPGPVATEMTRGLTKLPFLRTADKAALLIWKSINKKKNTAYIPYIWFPVMTIIKHIPEFIYKKLKL